MLKRLLFLFVLCLISSQAHGGYQTVFGPKEFNTGGRRIKFFRTWLEVKGPGEGLLMITNKTPQKRVRLGLIRVNRTRLILRNFPSGSDPVIEKEVSLGRRNRLFVFLYARHGAVISVEVRKKVAEQPPEVVFRAEPDAITGGESSTLSWTTAYADTVSIDHGIGNVALSGSVSVSPAESTTYTLTAAGPGGTTSKSTTLSVKAPLPGVSITADPESIEVGEPTTLSWKATNADTCTLEPGIGSVGVEGSVTITPSESTTYTIQAEGPGGIATASVEVVVLRPPDDVDHGMDRDEPQGGGGLLGESVRIVNGNSVESRTDLEFPSPNTLGLKFEAYYNSRSVRPGTLGYGWTHTYDIYLDPNHTMGDRSILRIVDESGRALYFSEATPGLWRGLFHERTYVKTEAEGYVWYGLDGSRRGFNGSGQLLWLEDEKEIA